MIAMGVDKQHRFPAFIPFLTFTDLPICNFAEVLSDLILFDLFESYRGRI
jgi:hypothetical protein